MALSLKMHHRLSSYNIWIKTLFPKLRPSASACFVQCLANSDYRRPGLRPDNQLPWKRNEFTFQKGVESVKKHFGLLKKEIVEHVTGPGGRTLKEEMLGQTRVIWEFRNPQDLENWTVSSDMEIGGKSKAFLKLGKNSQTALFYGNLSTEVPRDGETRYSGYCSMRSKPVLGALNRRLHYDWSNFNTLHLRVRGDGRPWMINIITETYFTLQKHDLYNYFLYTRGGPYWEDVKIPFSKFFLSSKGRIQDEQYPLWLDKITALGLTLGDKADGEFQLEIDFIALYNDRANTEEFAYEKYKRNPPSTDSLSTYSEALLLSSLLHIDSLTVSHVQSPLTNMFLHPSLHDIPTSNLTSLVKQQPPSFYHLHTYLYF
ncbi:complex I intermediate-associated protein 30, mitochondrial [Pelodytes ibericus]